jgi:WD40 repeat protein
MFDPNFDPKAPMDQSASEAQMKARLRVERKILGRLGETEARRVHPPPLIPDHELVRVIGTGAYGEVWLARNVVGTFRAIKVVYRDSFFDERPYEREFQGIQKFEPISRSNEGLVDILQMGRNDEKKCFYYIMELADSTDGSAAEQEAYAPKTLQQTIRRQGRLSFHETLELALPLSLAIGHLHRHGLIHRDIKPSNIIFVGGVPKLADIGLVTELEEANSFVGTEGFIPPEGPNSVQADIYSLGKVLYEMSMGKDRTEFPEPFTLLGQADDSEDLEELNAVILKACAPDPRDRYQTAEELHVDLALLQSGKSVKWKRILEKRLAAVKKGALAVAVFGIIATGAYLYQRHLHERAEKLAATMQVQHAESRLERGDSALGLAHLADVLRRQPHNRVAAERILAALSMRNFPRMTMKPLAHSSRLVLGPERPAHYSPDGKSIVTAAEDHSVRVWDSQTGLERFPPLRFQDTVRSVSFSPDSAKILVAFNQTDIQVFSAHDGRPALSPVAHPDRINVARFSPKGEWFASGADDGKARIFRARSGELAHSPLAHGGRVMSLDFSPDGAWLASISENGKLCIWNIESGKATHEFQKNCWGRLVRFSGDGRWLAASMQQTNGPWRVQVWDFRTRRPQGGPLQHGHRIYSVEFSPDGEFLISATADDVAYVWRVSTGQLLFKLQHSNMVYAGSFSPDGQTILTGSVDHTARLWDASTGAPLTESMLHEGRVLHAAFRPDGLQILTAGWEDGTVKLWEMPSRAAPQRTLPHSAPVVFAEFGPDAHDVITTTAANIVTANTDNSWSNFRPSVNLWDARANKLIFTPELSAGEAPLAAQFTIQGPRAFTVLRHRPPGAGARAFSTGTIWDLAARKAVGVVTNQPMINCARFSHDASVVAAGSADGSITIWDARKCVTLRVRLAHKSKINSIRFGPDDRLIVTTSDDRTAAIWELSSAKELARLEHSAEVWFAQFSPRGDKVVTASRDYTAKIWSRAGVLLTQVRHLAPVEYAEFSQDGSRLLTASSDNSARLWTAATGELLTAFEHKDGVLMARFSPDDLRVLTASQDGTAQLWDAETGLKLAEPFRHGDRVVSTSFSADGLNAITGSTDMSARIWRIPISTPASRASLPELAEAAGGLRLNSSRIPEMVPWDEQRETLKRFRSEPNSN